MALTTTDNKAKMTAAVARWISEAQGRSDGARLLSSKATWVSHQVRILGDRMLMTPPHLLGLTAEDLLSCEAQLRAAARALRAQMKAAA